MTASVPGTTTTPAMPALPTGSAPIDPQLAALIQSLPPEQQAQALAKIQSMSPEQQQQLVAQITAARQQQGSSTPGAPQGPAQAQDGAAAAQPGAPALPNTTGSTAAPAAASPAEPAPELDPVPAPPPPLRRYRVKRGDNLSVIAARYGLTWQQLYRANRAAVGSNPNLIHPGLKLVIPKR